MSNQEFTNPEEPQAYEPRNINTDPREQGQGPPQQEPMAGGFYNGLEQQQMGGAKLRPQRRRRRALWFLPILLLVVVLAIGAVVSRTGSFQSHSSRDSLPVGTFTVSGIPTLVIHDDTGVIHIHTGSAGDATIIVNVTGSFVIGFFATLTGPDGRLLVSSTVRQFVMIGICGGYTTFSSFSLQTLTLAQDGEWLWAGANIVLSVVLCLLVVWLGHVAAVALDS